MSKGKKWLSLLGIILALLFIRYITPDDPNEVAAEKQQIERLTPLVQLPESAKEYGFTRKADIDDDSIYIMDTAPEEMDVDLVFSKEYLSVAMQDLIDSLIGAGINPKQERINISIRLVFKEKTVTGNEETKTFGRIRYQYRIDAAEWLND